MKSFITFRLSGGEVGECVIGSGTFKKEKKRREVFRSFSIHTDSDRIAR